MRGITEGSGLDHFLFIALLHVLELLTAHYFGEKEQSYIIFWGLVVGLPWETILGE